MTAATTILNLPRFARELDVDRFHRALAFQLSLSLDGTVDNLIFVSFDVGEAGHAAFERALPAWTGS